jgi:leucyl aminopeptidase (aminopeptidase T)
VTNPLSDPSELLVRSALRIAPNEHVVVVDDAASQAIGDAITSAADGVGAWVRRVRLDRFTKRPLHSLPELVRRALEQAQVSVFVASELHRESSLRQAILHTVRVHGLRHAHLPGISPRGFSAGLRTSSDELARIGARVQRAVTGASMIVTESPAGTRLRVKLDPSCPWFAQVGTVTPGTWASFPAGAIYASPTRVDGVFVADACLGEFFGARAGLLTDRGVRLTIEEGHVVQVEASDPELQRELQATLRVAVNSDRVGLVAIGVNPGVLAPIGEAAVDQNLPGLHLGIGDPDARSSGATWRAQTCFAACQAASSVTVDGIEVVRHGMLVGPSMRPSGTSLAVARRVSTPFPSR